MHREGHIGAALIAYAPLGFVTTVAGFQEVALVGVVVAVGLAMVPDHDQRIPGLTHRGLTHTVWFGLAVGVVLGAIGGIIGAGRGPLATGGLAVFGLLVGVATIGSHIAADALTPMGVQPLAPFDDRHISYDVTRASNPLANYALLAAGLGIALGAYVLAEMVPL